MLECHTDPDASHHALEHSICSTAAKQRFFDLEYLEYYSSSKPQNQGSGRNFQFEDPPKSRALKSDYFLRIRPLKIFPSIWLVQNNGFGHDVPTTTTTTKQINRMRFSK